MRGSKPLADAERTQTEAAITALVSRALGDPQQPKPQPHDEFRALGLDSQSLVALIATVERQFGIQFGLDTPPEAFASIAQLTDEVRRLSSAQIAN
ncbi:Phosphopantetheine attachment site (plasmid) [Mycobacterium intracellulare subsp. chimaera]|uniref:Phosphopantetheine attachment site n=1 Tax=Mycobacterium intracellulare subsp. chimaera TaxID=222805 RepID=A0A7U5MRJ7_MYCIT|nr:Phosphopantetheine attachment site [Mycobacterium intracellulare subsp. chimaera]